MKRTLIFVFATVTLLAQGQGPISWTHYDQVTSVIGRTGYNKIIGFNGRTCLYEKSAQNASRFCHEKNSHPFGQIHQYPGPCRHGHQ